LDSQHRLDQSADAHPPRSGGATESLDEEPASRGCTFGANIDLERAFEQLPNVAGGGVAARRRGYTHEEIATDGKTVSFSKSQLARAHARLRRLLDQGAQA